MPIGGKHPFHLHGVSNPALQITTLRSDSTYDDQHTFSVVRSAGIGTYNFKNPVRRDTVSIGEMGDNVTIRFEVRGCM